MLNNLFDLEFDLSFESHIKIVLTAMIFESISGLDMSAELRNFRPTKQ